MLSAAENNLLVSNCNLYLFSIFCFAYSKVMMIVNVYCNYVAALNKILNYLGINLFFHFCKMASSFGHLNYNAIYNAVVTLFREVYYCIFVL